MSEVVRAALVQAQWTGDVTSMIDNAAAAAERAADQGWSEVSVPPSLGGAILKALSRWDPV